MNSLIIDCLIFAGLALLLVGPVVMGVWLMFQPSDHSRMLDEDDAKWDAALQAARRDHNGSV